MSSFHPLSSPDPVVSGPVASGLPDARRARRSTACPHCGEMPSRPKRPRAATTDEDYRASMLRMVNNYANRIEAVRRQPPWPTPWPYARPSIRSSTPASKRAARTPGPHRGPRSPPRRGCPAVPPPNDGPDSTQPARPAVNRPTCDDLPAGSVALDVALLPRPGHGLRPALVDLPGPRASGRAASRVHRRPPTGPQVGGRTPRRTRTEGSMTDDPFARMASYDDLYGVEQPDPDPVAPPRRSRRTAHRATTRERPDSGTDPHRRHQRQQRHTHRRPAQPPAGLRHQGRPARCGGGVTGWSPPPCSSSSAARASGKSTFASWVVGQLSTGRPWPAETDRRPRCAARCSPSRSPPSVSPPA